MDSLFSSERSRMKDISFDYSAEETSPKPNIPRVGRSFLRRGGILEDALEKGVFSRDIEGLFTTLVKEAESKQRSTMCVLGFLVCRDETCDSSKRDLYFRIYIT